ncbi:hypothetical protein [Brevibacillus aydinogluensis]|uniref:Uncharacterized protein n=1 Tax=Brevibacillus aydinogluensis TaxID=927786 RepID=A0AA48M6U8_9BACL|nr:hypothetical protein [Brevibacillus aydinogluensis]CAJ1001012.1 hypothetical protein BSPP4475_01560 [Brevibacillus aydinogluensis]
MDNHDNHDLFKEMYYFEHERRETINGRISLPIGVLPILIGAGLYCLDTQDEVSLGNWTCLFHISLTLYFCSLTVTTYFLMRAYLGYKYSYLPLPSEIDKYSKDLMDYFDNVPESERVQLVHQKVRIYLEGLYRDNTSSNMIENERKLQFLWRAGYFFIISVVIGAVMGFLYFAGKEDNLKKPTKVEIVNQTESNFSVRGGEQKMGDNNQRPSSSPTSSASQKPEPKPPAPRIINENFERIPDRPPTKPNSQ